LQYSAEFDTVEYRQVSFLASSGSVSHIVNRKWNARGDLRMNEQNSRVASATIFYSYAHTDEHLRDKLASHLNSLERQGLISAWHDRKIIPGTDWAKTIDIHLNESSIILLLVSPNFINSNYCYGIEMQRAIERHDANEARVIPILLRPVHWQGTPIARFQVLPTNAKSITEWRNRDKALADVVKGIQAAIEDLHTLSIRAPSSSFPPVWNIPYPKNPFFTGREDQLTRIATTLRQNRTVALTQPGTSDRASETSTPQAISGLGGIGKTQIAVEYAYRYRSDYQAVLWAQANTREILVSSFVAIAKLLNLPEKDVKNQATVIAAVKEWMKTHTQWLLIMDNGDQLEIVNEFIPPAFGGHILLTTRAQAMGRLAQRIVVDTMSPDVGTLFLLRRAAVIQASTPLEQAPEKERETAKEFVREMGGLPLALDQAGAYIEETNSSLIDYLNLYRKRKFDLLKQRGGIISDHPEPVATTWSLSFEQVEQTNPAAAELLRLCAFLSPDAIPEEIITQGAIHLGPQIQPLTQDTFAFNEALKALQSYSLINRDMVNNTLSIHRLVQEVLKEEMDQESYRLWTERAVLAVNEVFPHMDFLVWNQCERCLSNAQVCALLIEQNRIIIPAASRLLNEAGRYLTDRRRYTEAEAILQQALALREQQLGSEHPDTATSLICLGNLYFVQQSYAEAEPFYKRTLTIREKCFGPRHLATATAMNNLGDVYIAQKKYTEAESLCTQALSIRKELLGVEHPTTAASLKSMGDFYSSQGKYTEAEPFYKQALTIREQHLGSMHILTARSLDSLVHLYNLWGKYNEAEPLQIRALTIFEQLLGIEHPSTIASLKLLSQLYYAQGLYVQAEPLMQKIFAIQERTLGLAHPETILTIKSYVQFLRALHRETEATQLEARLPLTS
jgi:tetratricopeptide (TPR) repeat protein